MARGGEEYEAIELIFHGHSQSGKAIKVERDDGESMPQWIPVVCLDFESKRAIEGAVSGDKITLRITESMAREKGLI